MSTFDDDLLAALRRSSDPADQQLAGLLGELSPTADRRTGGPRANEALTSFLVGSDPGVARLTDSPVPVPEPDLVVALGRPTPRRRSMRSSVLVPLHRVLKTSLLAKVMLGATVAFTGAGAVAATGALQPDDTSVVTAAPAHDSQEPDEPADAVVSPEVEEEVEDDADDEGPDPEPTPEDEDEPDEDEADEVEDRDDGAHEDDDRDHDKSGDRDGDHDDGDHDDGDRDDDGDHDDGDHDDDADRDDYNVRTDPNHGVDFPYELCDADHDGDGDHDEADDSVHDVDRDGDGDHDDADHEAETDQDLDGDGDHDEADHALED